MVLFICSIFDIILMDIFIHGLKPPAITHRRLVTVRGGVSLHTVPSSNDVSAQTEQPTRRLMIQQVWC